MSLTIGTTQLIELTGLTARQIDYWCWQGVLDIEGSANGSGTRRRFSPEDVDVMRKLARLSRTFTLTTDQLGQVADQIRQDPDLEHFKVDGVQISYLNDD